MIGGYDLTDAGTFHLVDDGPVIAACD